jgi:hypothetical protein
MAEESRKEEKRILIGILDAIEKQLHVIVFEPTRGVHGVRFFRREFAAMLVEPWQQVQLHFRRSREMIEMDEFDWEYLEGVGMTGSWLRWKKRFLDETIRQRGRRRFFKVANSILGSLAKAIPPLEAVKEYKEHVEAAIRYPGS